MQAPIATIHAIVPVKQLAHAKSRLAAGLDAAGRRRLTLAMLDTTLTILAQSPSITTTWVVSSEPIAWECARAAGALPLADTNHGLNAALEQARHAATQAGAQAILVLPADLALLTSADITGLIGALHAPSSDAPSTLQQPVCVLAPNEDASGTNGMIFLATHPLPFLFGSDSYMRHRAAAAQLGIDVRVYTSATLALDIDTLADLERVSYTCILERRYLYGSHRILCGQ